jgi:hypothetical protein
MRIWLLGCADASIDVQAVVPGSTLATMSAKKGEAIRRAAAKVARWRTYAESYVLQHATELVSERVRAQMRRPFLQR